jgi:hypothetical protein
MWQSSNQVPTNPPARPTGEKEQTPTVGIVVLATAGEVGDSGSFGRIAHSHCDGLHAFATLQSRHVRIQT